jgi:hypothetical protein
MQTLILIKKFVICWIYLTKILDVSSGPRMTLKYSPSQSLSLIIRKTQNFLSRNGLDVFFLGRVFHFNEGFLEFPFLFYFL